MGNPELDNLRQQLHFLAGRQTEIHRERAFLDAEERNIVIRKQELHEMIGAIAIKNPRVLTDYTYFES